MKKLNQSLKYIIGFIICLIFRMVPGKPPNIEPLMTTAMPFAKKWGIIAGGLFAAFSMILFDLLHPTSGFGRIGSWTIVTAIMYGLIGVASGIYFKKYKENKTKHYVIFAIIATLIYDFITGPIMSSMIWKMSFSVAFIGQIPFTLLHLGGNIIGAAFISPLIFRWIIENKNLELTTIKNKFITSA